MNLIPSSPKYRLEPALASAVAAHVRDPRLLQVLVVPSEADAERAVAATCSLLEGGPLGPSTCALLPGFAQAGVFRYESARRNVARRLGALRSLLEGEVRILVASAQGVARVAPSEAWFHREALRLSAGDDLEPDALIAMLEERCYLQSQRVEEVGEYAVRGSIVDVWTPGGRHPTRVEFFGDALERIRSFRASDQRSFESREELVILPAREFVWPRQVDLPAAVEALNAALLSQGVGGRARADVLENLRHSVPFAGIDDAFPFFAASGDVSRFEDLLAAAARRHGLSMRVVLAGSPDAYLGVVRETAALYAGARSSAQGKNLFVPRLGDVFPAWAGAVDADVAVGPGEAPALALDAIAIPAPLEGAFDTPDAISARLTATAKGRFADRVAVIEDVLASGAASRVLVLCDDPESFEELAGLLARYIPAFGDLPDGWRPEPFPPALLAEPDAGSSHARISLGTRHLVALARVEAGFFVPSSGAVAPGLLAVSEGWLRGVVRDGADEVFSGSPTEGGAASDAANLKASREAAELLMQAQFGDFTEGDLVVHVQYGIARFRGLVTVKILDMSGDFLALEYAGADKIYVPVHKFNLVQKYVGASRDDNSVLDSLKKGDWEKRKQRAKVEAEKLAKELLEHQAKRAMTPGHAFGSPGEDWMSFCAAFPYDETPDQLKAVAEIMADMARPKAMDRLLVGDVGFGKTEVAFRAAFRCVLDGKQVAWLVPTTVLSHQHFRSALERFKGFGVEIEVVDRAVSAGAQSKILERAKRGEIDILIGTHRILSKDVAFRDLGLLVVDEEQRFGVLQKEKIKQMSYGVDVLTMTATPIPRTLQMAMIGLRELSLLTTPPKARLAVKTFVCPFEEGIVRDAIAQEFARGGQVFYVHNRVEDLPAVEQYLKALVPQARICVGHGKLPQKELDATVIEFLEGRHDLFLCTTIIESGIDMPGVNTILVQNADNFGLAQLYQLRGRVGRRSTRGYAYFLTSEGMRDEDEGARRLDILKEHQDLGSGFVIASHDLEMRGSGNVLGDDQSGRVIDVGLETYSQMLDDAIRQLGGMKVTIQRDVEIQVPLVARIPDDYIENARERLRVYRRFFGTRTEEALASLVAECEDRFGPLPETVKNLSELARVRRWLVTINALSLAVGDDCTELRLSQDVLQARDDDSAEKLFKRILDVCNRHMKGVRLTPDGKLLFNLRKRHFAPPNTESALRELKKLLSLLAGEAHEGTTG